MNGPRQQKVVWRNNGPLGLPSPTLYCRDTLYQAQAELCGPSDILADFWGDVQQCAQVGLGAATLAAIFTSPAGALPAFSGAFKICLQAKIGDRINEVQVHLSVNDTTGDWGPC